MHSSRLSLVLFYHVAIDIDIESVILMVNASGNLREEDKAKNEADTYEEEVVRSQSQRPCSERTEQVAFFAAKGEI